MSEQWRRWLRWILPLVAVGLAVVGWRYRSAGGERTSPRVETVRLDRGRIVARVTASGTISARTTVQVGTQVSGRIQELLVDYNTPVRKGQVLARIDPQLFLASLSQARAAHAIALGDRRAAEVRAADAHRQLDRARTLAAQNLVSSADLDTAQMNADAADAQFQSAVGRVAQARAVLGQARINLQYTTIASPIDGVVVSRSVDVGQTVAASLQTPTLFVLAEDLRQMQVDTSVAESDIGKVRADMAAAFTVDAFPGQQFEARVRQVRHAPQTVQNVVTYDAVLDVQNPELQLKPGMTANVSVVYARRDDVLRVPQAALRFRPTPEQVARLKGESSRRGPGAETGGRSEREPADQRTLWVQRGTPEVPVYEAVSIRTGVSDGAWTEVAEVLSGGLTAGDPVVVDVSAGGDGARGGPPSMGGGAPGGGGGGGGGLRRMF